MRRKTDGKGISLIVLVITIIIIIILAGAVILSLNNSNIISKAKLARNLQGFKQIREQIDMENNSMLLSGTFNPENVQLGSYSSKMRITSNGMIELNASGDSLRADTTFQETLEGLIIPKGANVPSLTTGMTPIMFDTTGLPIEANQTTNISKALLRSTSDVNTDDYWYDYKASVNAGGTDNTLSKWANVMLQDRTDANTMDGSQFVWIPRYAYKITYYTASDYATPSTNNAKTEYGTITVVFLAGTSNYKANDDGTLGDKVGEGSLIGYTVHPAFTNNAEAGGWDKELTGIWIAKYEAGFDLNATGTIKDTALKYSGKYSLALPTMSPKNYYTDTNPIVSGETIIKYPVFKPNSYSYNNITIGDTYSLSKELTANNNPYGLTSGVDTHLMKNSEWGAVVYLAHSQYGRNAVEVRINNYSKGSSGTLGMQNLRTITGFGSSTHDEALTSTITDDNRYNGIYGKLASTTGNVYGIYDMSGGCEERTAGYINMSSDSTNVINYSKAMSDDIQNKYKTVYAYNSVNETDINNYNQSSNISRKGEAISETTKESGGRLYNWFQDTGVYIRTDSPYFSRGGSQTNNAGEYPYACGIFNFWLKSGAAWIDAGFRPALVVTKGIG